MTTPTTALIAVQETVQLPMREHDSLPIRRLHVLGSPTRWHIIQLLLAHDDVLCVQDLVAHLAPLSQPTVSHHLRLLVDMDLLHRRKSGNWSYYSVRIEVLASLQYALLGLLPAGGVQVTEEEKARAIPSGQE